MRLGNPRKLIESAFYNLKLLQSLGFNNHSQKPINAHDNQYICINKKGELIGKLKAESLQQAKVGFACRFRYGHIQQVPLNTFNKKKKLEQTRSHGLDM